MISRIKKLLRPCVERVAQLAARSYVAGSELNDALRACQRITAENRAATIGYWNTEDESSHQVTAAYLEAIDALAKEAAACYLSIKAPALRFDRSCFKQVFDCARQKRVRLHFDALAPEAADDTFDLIAEALPQSPDLGCTLPGRWRRSLADADWVVEKRLPVRVVKGQWPDPDKPEVDLRAGFLAVIDRLAGRARHVAVATHDVLLAKEALGRLLKTKTPCQLELLYGLPRRPASQVAQAAGVSVRIYIPYGHGWLPYSISQVYKNPRILWWVFRDLWANR